METQRTKEQEIESRKKRRKNFDPRKWQSKWLKGGGLPERSKTNFTEAEYQEYWKDYIPRCSGCGCDVRKLKVKFRTLFQDWCFACYLARQFEWNVANWHQKIKLIYLDIADFFFKCAWYFQDRGKNDKSLS